MKKVIWIGPVINEKFLSDFSAVSPAANKWQLSFLNILLNKNVTIKNISYLSDSYFPAGKLFPLYKREAFGLSVFVRYINFPIFREFSLSVSIFLSSLKFKNYDTVITYNNPIYHKIPAFLLKVLCNLKWINIVADNYDTKGPDSTIYLSFYYFKNSIRKRKFHLDGGMYNANKTFNKSKSEKIILLYAGMINEWTGIIEFTDLFHKLKYTDFQNIELHIYGKGKSELISNLAAIDDRIKFKGFVPKDELESSMNNCFAFVNPRPINIRTGENNFPSKLLYYLPFGKPVISTITAGLSPDYRDVLIPFNGSLNHLSTIFFNITNLSKNEIKEMSNKIDAFVKENTWEVKVSNFLKFYEKSI